MGRTDHEKLATQTLNVVNERKNIQGTVRITDLTNYYVGKKEKPYEIPDDEAQRDPRQEYPWGNLIKLMVDKFGLDPTSDYLELDEVEARPDMNPHVPVHAMRITLAGENHWGDFLWCTANGIFRTRAYGEIHLVIKTRPAVGPPPQGHEYQKHLEILRGAEYDHESDEEPFAIERDPNASPPPPVDLNAPPVFHYLPRSRSPSPFKESDVEKDLIATSPESEDAQVSDAASASGASDVGPPPPRPTKPIVAKRSRLAQPPPSLRKAAQGKPGPSVAPRGRPGGAAPGAKRLAVPRAPSASTASGAASRDQSRTAIKLQLVEDRAQYETEDAQDDDYGAIDQTVIDTDVGAYNTGDSDRAWETCLSFFNIDPNAWARQEALRYKTAAASGAARKRVPMKKLPGMTVGLFDYQLIGVLNLLRNVLFNIPGGLLADEQGLGKTQEMFGVIALAHNLRKSKTEVKAEWKSGKPKQHNRPPREGESSSSGARGCRMDDRYGFRCYCYNGLTQMLADAIPEGPNFMLAPERSAQQLFREGKSKLDTKVLKLRLEHPNAAAEERLTPKEIKALTGKITASTTENGLEHGFEDWFEYQANPGQSDYVIISHPKALNKLTRGDFSVNVQTPGGDTVKKSGFLPGLVLMDEFHEYTSAAPSGQETRTIQWLKFLKQHHPPLVYFVSGTPFGDSPADIRPAIDLFDNPRFKSGADARVPHTKLSDFDVLIETFDNLLARQNGGEALPLEELAAYRKTLHRFLGTMMVRRLGVDKFRGRNLTDLGPLSVKITDHQAPPSLLSALQSLSNATRELVNKQLPPNTTVGNFLRSQAGADLLLKLRLASTFPGIATSAGDSFSFTPLEINSHLDEFDGNLTKTPYFEHIPTFSAFSPKLTTILNTVNTMIADKSKIPGESTSIKKLIIFSPLEAESMLIYGYLLLKKEKNKEIKPAWINSVYMDQYERQKVIDKFLTMGHSPPNILVAPMSLAGTGLNLQKAKYSIVTSPAWSKRNNQQAYYRVHRVGQTQQTKLSLLTARWNPADRVVLKKYEGLPVEGTDEEIWGVGDDFARLGDGKGLVQRHQTLHEEAK